MNDENIVNLGNALLDVLDALGAVLNGADELLKYGIGKDRAEEIVELALDYMQAVNEHEDQTGERLWI